MTVLIGVRTLRTFTPEYQNLPYITPYRCFYENTPKSAQSAHFMKAAGVKNGVQIAPTPAGAA
jgi:hypothetical protein